MSREIQQSNKAPRHHNDNFESDKRFIETVAELRLKLITGIPIRITNDLLYELVKINILTEISTDDKGDYNFYQPAESTSRLSVGLLIDRLESYGKWKLELDFHKFKSERWKKILMARSTYLENQRNILLKDL